MSQSFTPADVASHNSADKGMYIIVDSNVYDVTEFVDEHPGGAKILKRVAGKDASKQFWKVKEDPLPVHIAASMIPKNRSRCLLILRLVSSTLTSSSPAVSQRERAEEVFTQAEDRRGEGGGQTVI